MNWKSHHSSTPFNDDYDDEGHLHELTLFIILIGIIVLSYDNGGWLVVHFWYDKTFKRHDDARDFVIIYCTNTHTLRKCITTFLYFAILLNTFKDSCFNKIEFNLLRIMKTKMNGQPFLIILFGSANLHNLYAKEYQVKEYFSNFEHKILQILLRKYLS